MPAGQSSNASVFSSGRPPKKRASACSNSGSAGATAANKVMLERNFKSSGVPKMSWALLPRVARTSAVHSRSRGPRSGRIPSPIQIVEFPTEAAAGAPAPASDPQTGS